MSPYLIVSDQERDWMDYDVANFIVLTINTFMCLSSPLNLAVYCGMSSQFREQFTKILAETCGVSESPGPLVSVQLTLTQEQPRAAFTLQCETECPYLARNKRFCRRETSV